MLGSVLVFRGSMRGRCSVARFVCVDYATALFSLCKTADERVLGMDFFDLCRCISSLSM